MKLLWISILLSLASPSFCQNNKVYWPDGKLFNVENKTLNEIFDSLKMVCYHELSYKNTTVFYYPLSDKPAFIVTDNKSQIVDAVKSYKRSDYLTSYKFKENLKDLKKSLKVDSDYCKWAIGNPDQRLKMNDTVIWTYKKSNLAIYFMEGRMINYLVHPFQAIENAGYYITNYNYDIGNFSAGFSISIQNVSKKKVKYIWITVGAYNPVDDLISLKTVKCVGPVETGESGEWAFDNVFYSKVIDVVLLREIKIQYFDGAIKVTPRKDIRTLRIDLDILEDQL